MSIIIPAKNIYEINDQKVIDNEVDNIEVTVKDVSLSTKYSETVFHEVYDLSEQYYEQNLDNFDFKEDISRYRDGVLSSYQAIGVFNYVEYNNHKYINKTILIPKLKNNQFIQNLVLGTDSEGNRKINISIGGHTKTGTVSSSNWSGEINYVDDKYVFSNLQKNPFSYSEGVESEPIIFQIPTKLSIAETQDTIVGPLGKEASVFVFDGNIATVSPTTIIENGIEYYQLFLKILSGVRTVSFSSYNTAVNNPTKIEIPVNSFIKTNKYVEYIAEQVEISILGNTLFIDLKDETVKIGDGQHVYSFSGNELMQKSNIPTVDKTYKKIFREWKNGREIAQIKCGISEYYDIEKKIIYINVYYVEPIGVGSVTLKSKIYFTSPEEKLDLETINELKLPTLPGVFTTPIEKIIIKNEGESNEYYEAEIFGTISENGYDAEYSTKKLVIANKIGFPMTFQIGDIVCPYIINSNGIDKPMSLYVDNTPKEFFVIAKSIICDGEIFQEINLQEKQIQIIKVLEVISYNKANVEIISGSLQIGDKIEYRNAIAEVTNIISSSNQNQKFELNFEENNYWHSLKNGDVIKIKIISE